MNCHISCVMCMCNLLFMFSSEEDLRVIRPLIYVREKDLRQFAESRRLPIIPENCPACFEQPKVGSVPTIPENCPACFEQPKVGSGPAFKSD